MKINKLISLAFILNHAHSIEIIIDDFKNQDLEKTNVITSAKLEVSRGTNKSFFSFPNRSNGPLRYQIEEFLMDQVE